MEHIQSVDLRNIINASNVTVKDKFAILDDSNNAVLLCHAIPGYTSDPNPCQKVFIDGYGALASVGFNASSSDTCTQVLEWPAQMCVFQMLLNSFTVNLPGHRAHQAIRETMAIMALQVWLFTISVIAIIAESIPHV